MLLLTDSSDMLDAVATQVDVQLARLPRADIATQSLSRSRLILVKDIAQAIEISNRYAPEHLILSVREPRKWLDAICNAGSVFLGDYTPEALGDYCSGSNHVPVSYTHLDVYKRQVQAFLEDLCTPAELEAMGDRWRVVPHLSLIHI